MLPTDAATAPQDGHPTDGALRKARRRRRVRWVGVAGLLGVVAAIGAVVTTGGPGDQEQRPLIAAPSDPAGRMALPGTDSVAAPTSTGALRGGGTADCVESYSPVAVAARSFAVDGTVTAVGPARSNRSGVALPLAGVTLRVNEWFRGGTGGTVTIDMEAPADVSSGPLPAYGIGTRLLVSGEPRWGGAPLDAAIAWSCGFTRYYDPATAAAWASATR